MSFSFLFYDLKSSHRTTSTGITFVGIFDMIRNGNIIGYDRNPCCLKIDATVHAPTAMNIDVNKSATEVPKSKKCA